MANHHEKIEPDDVLDLIERPERASRWDIERDAFEREQSANTRPRRGQMHLGIRQKGERV